MAEVVPNLQVLEQTRAVSPQGEQAEQLKVGFPNGSKSPEKELTWLTPLSLHSGLGAPTPEHDAFEKLISWGALNGTLWINRE